MKNIIWSRCGISAILRLLNYLLTLLTRDVVLDLDFSSCPNARFGP